MKDNSILGALIELIEKTGAGFASTKIGKYTVIVTDDDEGAVCMQEAWDKYVDD